MDIGARIKQLRVKMGLTLEELAGRTELSKGYLSQLENELANPSVSTLEDIVEALGTDMSTFFKEEKEVAEVFTKEDFFIDQKEDSTVTYIVPNAQKNQMEPIILTLQSGGTSEVIKPHEGEEFGYILKGTVKLVFQTKTLTLKKGETFYVLGNNQHYIKNDSSTEAELLWICTPPIF